MATAQAATAPGRAVAKVAAGEEMWATQIASSQNRTTRSAHATTATASTASDLPLTNNGRTTAASAHTGAGARAPELIKPPST